MVVIYTGGEATSGLAAHLIAHRAPYFGWYLQPSFGGYYYFVVCGAIEEILLFPIEKVYPATRWKGVAPLDTKINIVHISKDLRVD